MATTEGSATAISVRGMRMSYDTYEAVRGIDFDVGSGEILAFLGPNGAGKTTTTGILEWLRDVAQVLPVRPLAVAMQAAYAPAANGGRTFARADLGIVAARGVAAAFFAVRRFSWLPGQR
ncbi:MAG TPA: ATP-binding cassette domain-containing protein [Streptosporangiaceae bacterium]|nr:ATP-binding cassette domain-containing protein [Streptosporangiaceae bacterium]